MRGSSYLRNGDTELKSSLKKLGKKWKESKCAFWSEMYG